ncbi:tail fiber assembly protein [Apirhabdus apintestini]|nr:tail fiber assembly protein [Enterobacteriaceae bacterium CA-0114]
MELKNLTIYTPDNQDNEPDGVEIAYLHDENGQDWYESQPEFSGDTMKIVYDDSGLIRSASMDVSTLWPVNASVTEVKPDSVPDGFAANGKWQYSDGEITAIPVDYIAQAEAEKSRLLAVATAAIAPLQDAVDLDIATDDETALLTAWKKYRVLLNRVDSSKAPDIEWPKAPE